MKTKSELPANEITSQTVIPTCPDMMLAMESAPRKKEKSLKIISCCSFMALSGVITYMHLSAYGDDINRMQNYAK